MSDYFNSFANPQGGGGQDIPQPGTPAWFQYMAMLRGGGQGSPLAAAATIPTGASPAVPSSVMPNVGAQNPYGAAGSGGAFGGPLGFGTSTAGGPSMGYAAMNMPPSQVRAGQGPNAIPPVPPPQAAQGPQQGQQSKQQQQPKPLAKRAPPAGPLAAPTAPIGGGAGNVMEAPTGTPRPPDSTTSQGGGYDTPTASVTPPTGPLYPAADVSLYPHALIAGAPSSGAVPNLGYYRPTSGIAQGPGTWTPYGPNDPRMFQGPLASQPGAAAAAPPPAPAAAPAAAAAAPGPGPIAPGAGTLWLRKLFGGGGQSTT